MLRCLEYGKLICALTFQYSVLSYVSAAEPFHINHGLALHTGSGQQI